MDRPFLQTPDWLSFQKSLGRKVWRLDDGFIKANIFRHDVRLNQNWLYIPYGPELNLDMAHQGVERGIAHFSDYLKHLAREQASMFVKIEPTHDMVVNLLYRGGIKLKKSSHHVQPMFTTVVDLSRSEDQLLDAMHHKHRYNCNLAERKGVTIEEGHDTDVFWKLLESTAARDRFRTHDRLYYAKLVHFFAPDRGGLLTVRQFVARHGGKPVAAVLILEHGTTVHYLHGAYDHEYRALMAPQLLHWRLMLRYRSLGFTDYDFWGVDSAKWPGVTRFKLGFGGKLVEYAGSFDFVTRPLWRWAYRHLPR
jgi:lipid II:glycine glycyltransferase (peptidoglycan interpeptide bridge formation enzyme)